MTIITEVEAYEKAEWATPSIGSHFDWAWRVIKNGKTLIKGACCGSYKTAKAKADESMRILDDPDRDKSLNKASQLQYGSVMNAG